MNKINKIKKFFSYATIFGLSCMQAATEDDGWEMIEKTSDKVYDDSFLIVPEDAAFSIIHPDQQKIDALKNKTQAMIDQINQRIEEIEKKKHNYRQSTIDGFRENLSSDEIISFKAQAAIQNTTLDELIKQVIEKNTVFTEMQKTYDEFIDELIAQKQKEIDKLKQQLAKLPQL